MKLIAVFLSSTLWVSVSLAGKTFIADCTPSTMVTSDPSTEAKTIKLSGKQITENKLKLVCKNNRTCNVPTRNDKEVKISMSGIYTIFYSDALTIKIDSSNNYFEFVSLGLSTITYFGNCK